MYQMLKLLKIIVIMGWASFIYLILGCLISLLLINYIPKYRKYLQELERLEKITNAHILLRTKRIVITRSSIITITALLILWYLQSINLLPIAKLLPSQFFLLSILVLIPVPFAFLIFEFYLKAILKKIKSDVYPADEGRE